MPSVIAYLYAGQVQIYYNHGGQLTHDVWVAHKGFVGPQAVGSTIIGSPAANITTVCQNIFYQNSSTTSSGKVTDLSQDSWCPASGWTNALDLTNALGADVPAAISQSPVGLSVTFGPPLALFFQDNNSLIEVGCADTSSEFPLLPDRPICP